MKKKIIIAIIAIAAVMVALATLLILRTVRRGKVPELESVKERYVELIEASHDVNELLFGQGLPTYPRIADEMKSHKTSVTIGKEHTIEYCIYENDAGKTVVRYPYYVRIDNVYYDLVSWEKVSVDDVKKIRYHYAEKTKDVREGAVYHDETTGYYYYLLPDEKAPSDENVMKSHQTTVILGKEHTIGYRVYENIDRKTVVQYQYYVYVDNVYYDLASWEKVSAEAVKANFYRYVEKTKEKRDGYLYYNESTKYYYYPLPDEKAPSFYYDEKDEIQYKYCTRDCGYSSVSSIKDKAEQVYSKDYLQTLYSGLFDGLSNPEYDGTVQYARYRHYTRDGGTYLQMLDPVMAGQSPYPTLDAIRYDYDTMRIVKGSTAKRTIVEIESYIEGDEQNRRTIRLNFALEGDTWYLDSPTHSVTSKTN